MIDTEKFYSIEDVAELLGVTYLLVYKLVRTGEITAIRVGKKFRISGTDLAAYLDQQRTVMQKEVEATTCSLCGKRYYSSLSIAGECRICSLPLCRNCVELNHAQYCEIHKDQENKSVEEA